MLGEELLNFEFRAKALDTMTVSLSYVGHTTPHKVVGYLFRYYLIDNVRWNPLESVGIYWRIKTILRSRSNFDANSSGNPDSNTFSESFSRKFSGLYTHCIIQ